MTNPFFSLAAAYESRQFFKNDSARDAGLTIPPDIETDDNLSYGPHGKDSLLCVYRPRERAGALPCIVNFHGGGFFYGTKETYQFYCADLARRGFAVVSFNYRLAPKNRFPAPLEDAAAVLRWLVSHAAEYGIDTGNVFFVGDSAGAQMVCQLCTIMTNEKYAALFSLDIPKGFTLRAVAMNSGMYDVLNLDKLDLRLVFLAYAGGEFRRKSPRLDTVGSIGAAFPPSFIATGSNDYVRSYAQPQAELLRSRGAECEYRLYGEEDDLRAEHVFQVNIRLDLARQCSDDECAFFRRHMA